MEIYNKMYEVLKLIPPGLSCNPVTIMTDFEKAAMNAFQRNFLSAEVAAGRKHPSGQKYQLVNKKIKSLITKLETYTLVDLQYLDQIAKVMVIPTEQ